MTSFKTAKEILRSGKTRRRNRWFELQWQHTLVGFFFFLKSRKAEFILNFSGLLTPRCSQLTLVRVHIFTYGFLYKACIYLVVKFQVLKHSQGQGNKSSLWEHGLRGRSSGEKSRGTAIYGAWLPSVRLSDSTIYVIMGFAAGALMLGPSAKSAIHTHFLDTASIQLESCSLWRPN